jgi:hypothetical protein
MADYPPDFDVCPRGPFGGKEQKDKIARILETHTVFPESAPEPKRSFWTRVRRNRPSKGIPALEWFRQVMGRDFS